MAYQNQKVKPRQTVAPNSQTKDLGIVSNVPMGEWSATTPYMKLNMVRSHGATYQAKKNNQGVEPTVTTGWQDVWQVVAYDGRGVSNTEVSYQAGTSNNVIPTGEWTSDIPDVPQGQYLWTRTLYQFTDGSEIPSYSVSLQGLGFTQEDRDNIENINGTVSQIQSDIDTLQSHVDKIDSYIPSSTTADNPLTNTAFVNSSINAMAAFYITSNAQGDAFPTKASLLAATTFYSGGQPRVPTQNDYATVLSDESQPKGPNDTYPTTRYTYQTDTQNGTYPNGQWALSFVVNATSLTQAQVNAINSGITAAGVSKLYGIEAGAQKNPTNYVTTDTAQTIDADKTVEIGPQDKNQGYFTVVCGQGKVLSVEQENHKPRIDIGSDPDTQGHVEVPMYLNNDSGEEGQVLTSHGPAATPSWKTPPTYELDTETKTLYITLNS